MSLIFFNFVFFSAADCLLVAYYQVDVRITKNYIQVLRVLFLLCEDQTDAMRYVYSLNFKNQRSKSILPQLQEYYKVYFLNINIVHIL